MDNINYTTILASWDLKFKAAHPEISIEGTPQHCQFRTVIEDSNSRKYILEEISCASVDRKEFIAQTLHELKTKDLKKNITYAKTLKNKYVANCQEKHWLLSKYIENIPLDRPDFLKDAWRGKAAADFLINLRLSSTTLTNYEDKEMFSLPEYITGLLDPIKDKEHELYSNLAPIVDHLKNSLYFAYNELPAAFCHGDLHQINILWDKQEIKAVIDWEFMGYKPEGYDLANLVGCLGMEDPYGLKSEFALELLKNIKEASFLSAKSREYFLDLVLALRFAWLSQWLCMNDREMIELELTYMYLLLDNRDLILKYWEM